MILQLKALGIDDIVHFDFPSPPPARFLANALELLYALKGLLNVHLCYINFRKAYIHPYIFIAIDDEGRLSDPFGLKMAELPVDPLMAKLLLMSDDFQCTAEIATIVAMMQVFHNP